VCLAIPADRSDECAGPNLKGGYDDEEDDEEDRRKNDEDGNQEDRAGCQHEGPETTKSNEGRSQGSQAIRTRKDTKSAIVLGLLRRKKGATIAEIAKATKWQNHSIRGFISPSVGKKMGLKVESAKNEAGERAYRVVT
jgi:hypothetical protein